MDVESTLQRIEEHLESIEAKLDRTAMGQVEYLDAEQLAERIPYAMGTIYQFVHNNVFIEGIHYTKGNGGRLIFFWREIERWLKKGGRS